jgi:N-acetylglucosaminyldiphosphoundecaprenol N-acetyl-beta-D-mannosaminyltransferase
LEIARTNILGIGVSAIDYDLAAAEIERWIRENSPHYVCVATVNAVVQSQNDEHLRRIHNLAGLVTPDGMPLVWLGRLMGYRQIQRVYGPDLLLHVCRNSIGRLRHYFYGGRSGVAELLTTKLCQRFPGLLVAGTGTPPVYPGTTRYRALMDDEERAMIDTINQSGADVVWFGLGTPYQERWMAGLLNKLNAPVLIGVGAAFDFHAGLVKQAPRWMQQLGLEWLFRLMMEPRRLWRRYLIGNSVFLWLLLRQALGRRPPPLDA